MRVQESLTEEDDMLVLSRKLGQSFRINDEIRITIVKIDRNAVRIGIDAPDHVSVQREEISFEATEQPVRRIQFMSA
jgi:carbon storage regulator